MPKTLDSIYKTRKTGSARSGKPTEKRPLEDRDAQEPAAKKAAIEIVDLRSETGTQSDHDATATSLKREAPVAASPKTTPGISKGHQAATPASAASSSSASPVPSTRPLRRQHSAARVSPSRSVPEDPAKDPEYVLKQFDLNPEYGPSVGLSRMERYERAVKLGWNPPAEVKDLLLKKDTPAAWAEPLWRSVKAWI